MKKIDGIKEILGQYDVFLFDVWGVIFNGIGVFPDVNDCLKKLKDMNKTSILLSNTSKTGDALLEFLKSVGLDVSTILFAQTSGDSVANEFFGAASEERKNEKIYHLSSNENERFFDNLCVNQVDDINLANKIAISCCAYEGDNLDDIEDELKKARSLNLPMVCLNPDKISKDGDRIKLCAGFFAEKYEKMGGEVLYFGKPHKRIYEDAFKRLSMVLKQPLCKNRMVMIGDSLETDICGAKNAGICSVLLNTGVFAHQQKMKNIDEKDSPTFEESKDDNRCQPNYWAEKLIW